MSCGNLELEKCLLVISFVLSENYDMTICDSSSLVSTTVEKWLISIIYCSVLDEGLKLAKLVC